MSRLILLAAALSALPKGAERYEPAEYTQSISTLNDRPNLRLVKISELDVKWHRSGGMAADTLFTSRKYRSGGRPTYAVEKIQVLNSFGYFQGEWGLTRTYPDGARFDDLLFNDRGQLFEHRVREKKDGRWVNRREVNEPKFYPKGYIGLKVTCVECHSKSGSGLYGVGLVPGSDTILSDPMRWSEVSESLAGYR